MINFDKNQLLTLFPSIERENQDLFAHLVGTIAENIDLFAACEQQHPIMHQDSNYGCISAIIFRARSCIRESVGRGLAPAAPSHLRLQAELMSKNRGCVVIARPEDVKIIKLRMNNEK